MPPAAIMMFGAPGGGSRRAVDVGVVQEVDVVDHDALLGGGLALQHPRAVDDTRVLLGRDGEIGLSPVLVGT